MSEITEEENFLEIITAWQTYDFARSEYESMKDRWDYAPTTISANYHLKDAIEARDEYEKALVKLRDLGYEPCGNNPVKSTYFNKEK